MTLRLDTYPEEQIATHMTPQNPSSTTPMLCCLLHTGSLLPSHQIEVWIEGAPQIPQQEGTQQVFSWQCTRGVEMRIHLMQHGRLAKAWRGWWQGATTIAHTGTLAVQVYCAGQLQPAGLPPSFATPVGAAVRPISADQHNGVHHEAVSSVLTWPAVSAPSPSSLPAAEDLPEDDDDLWSHRPHEGLPTVPEMREAEVTQILGEDAREAEADLEDEDGEETGGEEGETAEEQGETEEFATLQEMPGKEERNDASASPSPISAPAGTIIATLLANTVWSQDAHQEAEARLTALLASMPQNTILVDLRQHTPTPRRSTRSKAASGPQKLGLSKELLRNLYGGRYWDRGAAIQTSRRLKSVRPANWGRVVTNPEDPDGLGTLITALTQGFSLLVLDGETKYTESARATVLSELSQRVANLTVGSCS